MTLSQPWAKIDTAPTGEIRRRHHLIAHALDTAAVAERMLRGRDLRRRLANAGGLDDLEPVQCARIALLIGLHDVGKLNTGFVCRADSRNWRGKPPAAGHVAEAFALFKGERQNAFVGALGGQDFLNWASNDDGDGYAITGLLMAVLSHHGEPVGFPDDAEIARMDPLWDDLTAPGGERLTPMTWLRELIDALKRALPEAWAPGGTPLPDSPHFQDMVAGLAAVADWVASSETAGNEPAFGWTPDPDQRMAIARATAERLGQRIGLTNETSLDPRGISAERVIGAAPNSLQKAVSEIDVEGRQATRVLIESLTGSGKTEALLLHFLRMWAAGQVSGLYVALPTRTSAVQIYERIADALARLLGPASPPVVLAVPGYIRVDDVSGRRQGNRGVLWTEDPGARGWAAENPARFLAAPIVIGTVDQALMSTIAVRHAPMRAALLSRMMLAVDEVHASDSYVGRLTEELVARTRAAGGHSVLMSATCGGELAARFMGGAAPAYETALRRPYPAVTWNAKDQAPRITRVPWSGQRTVRIETPEIMDDEAEIAKQALAAARRGAKVLVIANTVRRANEIQSHLEAFAEQHQCPGRVFRLNGRATPHHSRYAPEDRRRLDAAAMAALGRGRPAGGKVLVATQTMEQSIDVDADLLITDLCPMDVLLQRIGRLHRHPEATRPRGFKRPKAIVAMPAGDLSRFIFQPKHGLGTVYLDIRVIEATRRALVARSRIVMPRDSRLLVESAVHTDALDDLVSSLGGTWNFKNAEVAESVHGARMQAETALREVDHAYNDPRKPGYPLDRERVQTRLGEPDNIAVFHPKATGPFGEPVGRLPIPQGMSAGADRSSRPLIHQRLSGGGFTFQYGFADADRTQVGMFVYDRHGLRPLET